MFTCLECGKRFRSVQAAERAALDGCPRCGGVDIDVAPLTESERQVVEQYRRAERRGTTGHAASRRVRP
jgi:predicted  nucleic acid-binding Zn-ribbon protein